ncbi:MAG: glycosyltransferase, partial [Flavobacteriales bacterium]
LTIYPHLGDEALTRAITLAKQIVCRSGYTTLMDLHALGRNAVLIPTPGQTEQEYLAAHFHDTFGWPVIRQERIVTELPALLNAIPSRNS